MTGVEWADKYFYLPEGSSQISGRWTTQPLQVAPLNMMCNDAIREVDWQKSARVGYTKLLVAAMMYLSEHKSRNGVVYQPTEDDAKDFTIDEIDGAIAQMPVMHQVFPAWSSNDENNTVKKKKGLTFTLDIKGATTPKNFRRLTKQFLAGDEIDAWPLEVGREGDPIKLALTRLSGASFPKAIFGTTPTIKGISHIERRMTVADAVFRFYLPCPHCGHEQTLGWGGKGALHGMGWDSSKPADQLTSADVYYRCKNKDCAKDYPKGKGRFYYKDLALIEPGSRWIADKSGIWTVDGLSFFSSAGVRIEAPRHVGLYINALYSLTLTDGWVGLVREWLEAKGDPLKLKTFINLVLGELWEDETGEKLDWEVLKARREAYRARVPMNGLYLTCFCDTQDDRFELVTVAWGRGEESWVVDYRVIYGNLNEPQIWDDLEDYVKNSRFRHEAGFDMKIRRYGQDAGGSYWDSVNRFVKRFPEHFMVACKGDSKYGQPVVRYDQKKNKHGVRLCWIGTDTAKDGLYGRYGILPKSGGDAVSGAPVPGMVHFPVAGWCGDEFFQQATSEVKRIVITNGRKVYKYEPKTSSTRNEVLDCLAGNVAMVRLSINYFDLKLDALWESLQVRVNGSSVACQSVKKKRKRVTGGV